jgi:hypothetical protein
MKVNKKVKHYDDEESEPCEDNEYYEDLYTDEDVDGLSDNDNWMYWLGMENDNIDGGSARLKRIGKNWSE